VYVIFEFIDYLLIIFEGKEYKYSSQFTFFSLTATLICSKMHTLLMMVLTWL